jgi:hypothetical protein
VIVGLKAYNFTACSVALQVIAPHPLHSLLLPIVVQVAQFDCPPRYTPVRHDESGVSSKLYVRMQLPLPLPPTKDAVKVPLM